MPWKTNSKYRWSAPRGRRWSGPRPRGVNRATAAAINRRSPKKTDRVVLYNDLCAVRSTEIVACAEIPEQPELGPVPQSIDSTLFQPTGVAIPYQLDLITPQKDLDADGSPVLPLGLETFYVTRIRGWVRGSPVFFPWAVEGPPPETCAADRFKMLHNGYRVRAGLIKEPWQWDGDDWESPTRNPLDSEDWADVPYLRRYDKFSQNPWPQWYHNQVCAEDAIFYADVDGALAGGTGGIATDLNYSAASGADPAVDYSVGTGGGQMGAHTPNLYLSMNMKRRLKMEPADGLALHIAFTNGSDWLSAFGDLQQFNAVGFGLQAFIEVTIER